MDGSTEARDDQPIDREHSRMGRVVLALSLAMSLTMSLAIGLSAGCGSTSRSARTAPPEPEVTEESDSILGALGYIDEEFIIEAFPDADPEEIAELLEQLDDELLEQIEDLDLSLTDLNPEDLEAIADELESNGLPEGP